MRKVCDIFCDYIVPIALVIGNILLAYLALPLLSYDKGYLAFGVVLLYWFYGFASCYEIIPFIKRIIKRRTQKTGA